LGPAGVAVTKTSFSTTGVGEAQAASSMVTKASILKMNFHLILPLLPFVARYLNIPEHY
jgi:hypothetical protein